ncbi:hypothetical protein TSOC_006395 [Tetrabaena socialis]|uniref:Uncharacterized protein n=1 Tax=Tetrabaena socialis TaxID=47790 RepID=A0A2J8A3S4_9CHLO|nr:hypothetical protein TSOC_006395 [Tetrabaena socialis]|eukprot:PNH07156.1 hypothetical protein TSOC_006395 [Tetrabaena socialis]
MLNLFRALSRRLAARADEDATTLMNTNAPCAFMSDEPPAVWAEESASRPLSISMALARRCELGVGLIDLRDEADAQDQDAAAGSGSGPGAASLEVPGVPGRVPSHGVAALDLWAEQYELAGGHDATWLPAFLVGHACELAAAACAADFLGCRAFLDLALGVALLRVALRGGEALQPGCRVPPLASLSEDDFRKLSCLQRQQEAGPLESALPPPPLGAAQHAPALQGAAEGAGPHAPAGGNDAGSAQAESDGLNGAAPVPPPVVPRQPEGEGAAGGQPPLPLPPLAVAPEQLEALVAALLASNLLAFTGAQAEDVRLGLYRLGFRPTIAAQKQGEAIVSNGKAAYLRLQLGDGAAGSWRAAASYRVAAVAVEVEAHDQGWSSYPEDRETLRNSWTWGELVLLGPHGQPTRPGDPGRLFTNLHAVDRWQTHSLVLGADSGIVQDLRCLAAAAASGDAAAGAGRPHGSAAAGTEGAHQSGPAQAPQLVLFVCAAFAGWRHFVRRAKVSVELCPHSYAEV